MSKLKIAFYKIYKIIIRKVQRVLEVTSLRVSLGAMVTRVGGKLDVAFLCRGNSVQLSRLNYEDTGCRV